MQLVDKEMNVLVFQVDNEVFEQVGEVNKIKSLIWQTPFNDYGEFQLTVPLDNENKELLKEGRFLWTGEEVAGIVEYVQNDVDDNGLQVMKVKGHTLEKLLESRVINGTYNVTNGTVSGAVSALVQQLAVNPSDTKRKIPWLTVATDEDVVPDELSMQKTGGSIYDYIMDLTETYEFGFRIVFDPLNKQLVFKVLKGVDRTIDNGKVDPVLLSTDMEDIIESTYTLDVSEWKNVAYVYGEDEGSARKSVIAGDNNLAGFDRREIYVDAKSVRKEVRNDDGSTTTLSDTEYAKQLVESGKEELSENVREETFEANVRFFGKTMFTYGEDYKVGDRISVADERLGVQADMWIVLAEESKDDEYSLSLTVGFQKPSLYKVMRRMVKREV